MRTRALALLALAASALVAAPKTAAGAAPVGVTVGHATFPERALVVSLPHSTSLSAAGIRVYENGVRVETVRVTGRDSKAIGFVLAIDESASMRGAPLQHALAAAQAFAERRQAPQALGIVTFNGSTATLLAPTTKSDAISSALARPAQVGVGTRLWDAVARSIHLLQDAGVQAGSVVVLSDGRDTRSTATPAQVVTQARDAGVRIFTVGLRSPQFDPATLRAVAAGTGASYAETSSRGLVEVFAALGARLAREYVVEYRSGAPLGSTVNVAVTVPAFGRVTGTATATYVAPLPSGGGVLHRSAVSRFVASDWSIAAVAIAAALMAIAGALLALRAARNKPLARRLRPYAVRETPLVQEAGPEDAPSAVTRSLRHAHAWERFEYDLEIGRVRHSAARLALVAVAAALAIAAIAVSAGAAWLALLAIVPPFIVRSYAANRASASRRAFEEQLPDTLQVLASALRAGHGMTSAIRLGVEESKEPMRSELRRALTDDQLGMPLDEALAVTAKRMESIDLEHVAFVTGVHRQTGGNTAEVLDRVHDAVRERFELRRMVRTLTAQARMTRWILALLPAVLALAVALLNPGYMHPLYGTTIGRAVIALAVAMVGTGFLLIKRLTEIKV